MSYDGKVAFITGGASGAAFGQAQLFGRLGCRIFIVDVRGDALEEALAKLRAEGVTAEGAQLDITDRAAFARVADQVEHVYGEPPYFLFNTAGVFAMGPSESSTYEDYDWVFGVNLGGVINGLVTFVPRMIKAGRGGHIVSTSSVGGFLTYDGNTLYCAAKAAVISLMEGYRGALEKYGIGVSVLCPMNIRSNIARSANTRPAHLAKTGYVVNDETVASLQSVYDHGMDPIELAGHVRRGIEANQLYIIPYPEARPVMEQRYNEILDSVLPVEADPDGVASRLATIDVWMRERGTIFEQKSPDAPA
ncbi:MAG: SDR family NAD(P)-dependent oxidoreductase [Sphingomonas sp.]|nr:SDR family NAD(P)-dependent oxidoreductase [Sphingomonas sp.]